MYNNKISLSYSNKGRYYTVAVQNSFSLNTLYDHSSLN